MIHVRQLYQSLSFSYIIDTRCSCIYDLRSKFTLCNLVSDLVPGSLGESENCDGARALGVAATHSNKEDSDIKHDSPIIDVSIQPTHRR